MAVVNHVGERCGVFQFGKNVARLLDADPRVSVVHVQCAGPEDFETAIVGQSWDIVLVNHHAVTMGWLDADRMSRVSGVKFILVHEITNAQANHVVIEGYDFYLVPDPTLVPWNSRVVPVPRFAPCVNRSAEPVYDVPTIGSFGFATDGKGFATICRKVREEFEQAAIRLNIPRHDNSSLVSDEARERIVAECRQVLEGSDIALDVTDHFFDDEGLLDFCSMNHLNVLAYESGGARGISSCVDVMLAAARPFVVSDSPMFRHVHQLQPTVRMSQTSLRRAMSVDPQLHAHTRRQLAPEVAGRRWIDAILDAVDRKALLDSVPDGTGMNKVLNDHSRAAYQPVIQEMWTATPALMERKIAEANVQQAFVLDAVRRLATRYDSPRILSVGAFEDTAFEGLRASGYRVTGIDPMTDLSLTDFYLSETTALSSFEIVFSTSVIEHVEDDVTFVRQCADLLRPGGVLVLTADFKDSYVDGDPKPSVDFRLYTSRMFRERLMGVLPDCRLYNEGLWEGSTPDFTFEGVDYNFATLVIEKMPNTRLYVDPEHHDPVAGSAWRRFAAHEVPSDERPRSLRSGFGTVQPQRYMEAGQLQAMLAAARTAAELRRMAAKTEEKQLEFVRHLGAAGLDLDGEA